MNATVVSQLGDFCRRLELPLGTAKELITFLTVKTLVGQRKARRLSPSSKLDKLLHAVLLDTELRKSVEVLVGEIHHSEASAGLEDSLKAERRLASMNAMSKLGYDPDLALWEDPNTLLHSISFTDFKDYETGVRVKTYSATQMSTEYGGHAHRSLTIPGSGYLEGDAAGSANSAKRHRGQEGYEDENATISLKTMTGRTIVIQRELLEHDTVEHLMSEIHKIEGIPIDQQHLIACGKPLIKGTRLRALRDQGYFKDALTFNLRLRGC